MDGEAPLVQDAEKQDGTITAASSSHIAVVDIDSHFPPRISLTLPRRIGILLLYEQLNLCEYPE